MVHRDMTVRRKGLRWLWLAGSSILVVAGVGAFFLLGSDEEPQADEATKGVVEESHYYVLLTLIEVTPKTTDGSKWDPDGSGPDLYYRIHWQGQPVFESATKSDTLLAKWSNASVEIGPLTERVSLDDSIKAARITARPGDELEIVILDRDVFKDDVVARWKVAVDKLQVGDQRWDKPAGDVVSVICRVLALDRVKLEDLTR